MLLSLPEETAEERSARIDDILKKNSFVGVCISCNEDILGEQPVLRTIHGLYHDAPKTCVEGRPGFD